MVDGAALLVDLRNLRDGPADELVEVLGLELVRVRGEHCQVGDAVGRGARRERRGLVDERGQDREST